MNQSSKDKLITDNLKLVYYIYEKLSKNKITNCYKDDIISEGIVGLVRAARTFDEDKGYKFATYATRCIRNEMFMYLRKLNRQNKEISLDTPIRREKDGNEICLIDVLEDENGNLETEVDKNMLQAFIEEQSDKDRKIVELIFNGYSQKEVAKKMQVTQPCVSRRMTKLKKKAKDKFKVC